MKKSNLLLILTIIFFSSCFQSSSDNNKADDELVNDNSTYHEKKWYSGGTLHKSSVSEWKNSTAENKLATCGDFMATVDNTVTMDELKSRAINLKNCIDEATLDSTYTDSEAVSFIASLCVKTLGY